MTQSNDIVDVEPVGERHLSQPADDSLKTWGWISYLLHLIVAVAAVVPLPMPVFVSGSGSLHPVRTEAASVQAHSAVAKIAVRVTSSPELRVVWWSAEADRPVP